MIIFILTLLGLCLGSFVNALIWRLHKQASSVPSKSKKFRLTTGQPNLSIMTGRSMCPNCQHILAAKDLIPVISWLQLRGRCRYCHKKFDDTPVTELIVPVLFVVSYIYWPLVWDNKAVFLFVCWILFIVGFVALIVYDIRWLLLPNRIVWPLAVLSFIQVVVATTIYGGGYKLILASFYGLIIGGGIFYLLFQTSRGEWIGGGDVKLGAVLGIIVGGPWQALLLLFVASCLGTLFSLPMLLTGKASKTSKIPFGPFLIAATIIVYLFGSSIIAWYKKLLMIG